MTEVVAAPLGMDLSDVDHRVGKLVGGGQLLEPCNKTHPKGSVKRIAPLAMKRRDR